MQDTLKDHDSTIYIYIYIYIGCRPISNISFAYDIVLIAGSSNELQKLTDLLAKNVSRYGMEISHEKSKILINDPDPNKDNSYNLEIII